MSLLSPYLNNDNAKEILPKVLNQPTRQVERVLAEAFPERAQKAEVFKVELDEELKSLLAKAQELASEKDARSLLKKVLSSYVRERKERTSKVKRHTRYVPKRIARDVKQRDGYQCTYKSPNGMRCNQKAHLQLDHIQPWAKDGSSLDKDNLRLLCRAHNLYLAKIDFPNEANPLRWTPRAP